MIPYRDRPSFADIAVELRLAENDARFDEIAFALTLEAMAAGLRRERLEVIAHRIGLSADATARVLDHWEERARLMHAAHVLIKAMIPYEAELRELATARCPDAQDLRRSA